MRHRYFIPFAIGAIMAFCACGSYPVAQQTGKEDTAYLLFVSPDQYAGEKVDVTLDGTEPFVAKVVKEKKSKRKGKAYAVRTGRRKIAVRHDGTLLYNKKIFISSQETKVISLP